MNKTAGSAFLKNVPAILLPAKQNVVGRQPRHIDRFNYFSWNQFVWDFSICCRIFSQGKGIFWGTLQIFEGYCYFLLNILLILFCSILLTNTAEPNETRPLTKVLWLKMSPVVSEMAWRKASFARLAGFMFALRSFQLSLIFSSSVSRC